jgi:hypothetical protein
VVLDRPEIFPACLYVTHSRATSACIALPSWSPVRFIAFIVAQM